MFPVFSGVLPVFGVFFRVPFVVAVFLLERVVRWFFIELLRFLIGVE